MQFNNHFKPTAWHKPFLGLWSRRSSATHPPHFSANQPCAALPHPPQNHPQRKLQHNNEFPYSLVLALRSPVAASGLFVLILHIIADLYAYVYLDLMSMCGSLFYTLPGQIANNQLPDQKTLTGECTYTRKWSNHTGIRVGWCIRVSQKVCLLFLLAFEVSVLRSNVFCPCSGK